MTGDRDPRQRLIDFWDSSREYYELAVERNPEAAPERQFLFGFLGGGERLLDLGSGSCENALWLPRGCTYVGTDVSLTGLAMATELGRPGLRFRGDGTRLPVADESFDAVLSTWSIEHLHDPGQTLAEMLRVLRLGGLLLLVGSAWDLPHAIPPSVHPRRRLAVASRRLVRQLHSWADGRARFDIVREPRVLTEGFVPDADAVHVTQSYVLCRFLAAAGMEILEHRNLPHNTRPNPAQRVLRRLLRQVPLWRHGWGDTLIVARRRERRQVPAFKNCYL